MEPTYRYYHGRIGIPFNRITAVYEALNTTLRGYSVHIRVHEKELILDNDRNHYRALDLTIEVGSVITFRHMMRKLIAIIHPEEKSISIPIYLFHSLYDVMSQTGLVKATENLTGASIAIPTHKICRFPIREFIEENAINLTSLNHYNLPHDEFIVRLAGCPQDISDAISNIFVQLCHYLWKKYPDSIDLYPFWYYMYAVRRDSAEGEIRVIPAMTSIARLPSTRG